MTNNFYISSSDIIHLLSNQLYERGLYERKENSTC
nr:MAG TPA: Flagellar M-ring protein, Flagellar motor motor, switch complex, MOTOR [Caudoviricetes sp.]DAX89141.1 MAG TPA: Flagellar M-ring protein, Flagellar motor motor, switch complex, MOTOR [Caudoviricetes sp.]